MRMSDSIADQSPLAKALFHAATRFQIFQQKRASRLPRQRASTEFLYCCVVETDHDNWWNNRLKCASYVRDGLWFVSLLFPRALVCFSAFFSVHTNIFLPYIMYVNRRPTQTNMGLRDLPIYPNKFYVMMCGEASAIGCPSKPPFLGVVVDFLKQWDFGPGKKRRKTLRC